MGKSAVRLLPGAPGYRRGIAPAAAEDAGGGPAGVGHRDRVVGTLDIEHAIKKGEKRFEPGVLAEANRGILYVDEVNLLDDHVVDVLLDAAAMWVNTVEREGVSFTHPARFILVGTMNPEEGELRPQLLDRFGLCVNIAGVAALNGRTEVTEANIRETANLALLHRMRRRPFQELALDEAKLSDCFLASFQV